MLEIAKRGLLRRVIEVGERLVVLLLAVRVAGRDAVTIDVARHEAQRVAHFRRLIGVERPLPVPQLAVAEGRFHLTVDELRHIGLKRSRAEIVGGNQPIDGGIHETPFVSGIVFGFVGRSRRGHSTDKPRHGKTRVLRKSRKLLIK